MLRITFLLSLLFSINTLFVGASVAKEPVQYPEIKKRVDPRYPAVAARDSLEGSVDLMFSINQKGRTENVVIVGSSGHKGFDKEAVKAVRKWRYEEGDGSDNLLFGSASVTLTYGLMGAQSPMRDEITALYDQAQALIEQKDVEQAASVVSALNKFDTFSRNEALMYWSVMAGYYDLRDDFSSHYYALYKLQKVLEITELSKESKDQNDARLFVAAVNSNNYEQAFSAFEHMQKENNPNVAKFEDLYNELKQEFSAMTQNEKQLILHENVRPVKLSTSNFSIQVNSGKVDSVELRCQNKFLVLPEGSLEYQSDEQTSDCYLVLKGQKGSKLKVTQTL